MLVVVDRCFKFCLWHLAHLFLNRLLWQEHDLLLQNFDQAVAHEEPCPRTLESRIVWG